MPEVFRLMEHKPPLEIESRSAIMGATQGLFIHPFVYFRLYTDIWLPEVSNQLRNRNGEDGLQDNRPLALCHPKA